MKLIKIESLCTVIPSSWRFGDQLMPVGSYKFFFEDGTSHIQNYILIKDKKQVGKVNKVEEFSKDERGN